MKIKARKLLAVLCVIATIVTTLVPTAIFTAAAEDTEIVFALGANGTASHNDGSSVTTYSETVDGYTLSITNGTKMYKGARDAKGNSCIKLGTGSVVGSFQFIVPDDVTSVVISIAKYKAKTSKINVNGTAYTLTNSSDNGAYDEITVDTTTNKTVKLTTVSSGYRAMVNTITYVIPAATGDCQHANTVAKDEIAPDCTNIGFKAGTFCNDCKTYIEGGETIDALGHTSDDIVPGTDASCTSTGKSDTVKCSVCGETTTASTTTPATAHDYVDGACSVCGAVAPVAEPETGVAYKFFMDQRNRAERLYLTGAMSNYYYAATKNVDEAVNVYLTEVEDGYKIYFVLNEATKYLSIEVSGTHTNVVFKDNADDAIAFAWNDEYLTFTATVGENEFFIGTYKTFNTFSPSKISYLASGNFPAQLIKVDGADVPTPDPDPGETKPEETEPEETEPAETEPAETEPSAPAEEVEAELSFADANNRTEYSTTIQVWSANGITLTNNKGASTSDVGDYTNPARFYASSQIIIAAPGNITKIVFDCNKASYATALKNSIGDAAVANDDKVTVTLDGSSNSYTIAKITAQVRMDAITVTYGGAGAPAAKDEIAQVSVNVGADLSMLAHISASDITGYTVKFIRNGAEVLATTYTEKDGKFVFALDKIAPQAMADVITIQLIKDGEVVDTIDYSVKAYAQAILSGDYDAARKTLVSDMLAYGAAAQKHTGYNLENLATDGVTGLVCSTATPDASVNVNKGQQNAAKVDGLGFSSVGVRFDNANYIYAKFNATSLDGITVTINGAAAGVVDLGNGEYIVYSDAILATAFGTTYTIVLNYNGAAYQTLTYSVNSYAFAKANTELGLALYRYGASAAALLA